MSPTRVLTVVSLTFVSTLALAQASLHRPDPLDPDAPTTRLTVPKTFDEYVPYKEPKVGPWKDTNAAVSTDGMAGMDHSKMAGMKYDMGDMKTVPQRASGSQMQGHSMPVAPTAQPSQGGNTSQKPTQNSDHSTHKM